MFECLSILAIKKTRLWLSNVVTCPVMGLGLAFYIVGNQF